MRISTSPNSIIALNKRTLWAFFKSCIVMSASWMMPCSKRQALFVPSNNGCFGVIQRIPSDMARFVKEVSVTRPCLTMMTSSQLPFSADKALRCERSVLLKPYSIVSSVTTCNEEMFLNVINLLRQLFHVFAQFFLGNLGIHLGCLYILVTKHRTHGFYWNSIGETNRGCERMTAHVHNLSKSNGK